MMTRIKKIKDFMKNPKWVGLLAAAALPLQTGCAQAPVQPRPTAVPVNPTAAPVTPTAVPAFETGSASSEISPPAAEVVRLAESGVGEDVLLAYIQNSQGSFNLTADHVLYLKDVGLSTP